MIGCSLYRFYDAAGTLLYVGITSVGPERWKEHEDHRKWWAMVARTTVEHFPDRTSATTAERSAIRAEHPLHNVKHNGPEKPAKREIYRKHGEGTIHQRADSGRWLVAITFPSSAPGERERYSTTFTDEHEARLFHAAMAYRGVREVVRRRAIAILEAGEDWRPD